ncbi:MAG: PepSY domain-containing protein [Peptostreptococcaceae bacterium]|nr:PepSY domain-containing protein [Peptostreptococcaceae bacterium]
MKFAKKISMLGLASIIISTNTAFIVNADTINTKSDNSLAIESRASISREKAKQIMLNKVPGGTLVEFSYDYDDGVPIYEGKIIKGQYEYEIEVHANTGRILKFERDYRDYDDGYGNIGNGGSNVNKQLIGEAKAKQIMLNKVPGGKIIYLDFEYDDGIPVYEGKIVGIVDAKDADENTLGLMMAGGEDNE